LRTPLIFSGFGCFSRIIGPWADWPTGFRSDPQTPFGLAVGTVIDGGATGAIITCITVDPPANMAPSTFGPAFRIVVLRGRAPGILLPWQHTTRGWPDVGESQENAAPLWSKMFATKSVADNTASDNQNEHFPFGNGGPSCEPGEQMAVLYLLTNDEPGPGYGSGVRTWATFSVLGRYGRSKARAGTYQPTGRSIARGVLA
jgi:hypothetical protein